VPEASPHGVGNDTPGNYWSTIKLFNIPVITHYGSGNVRVEVFTLLIERLDTVPVLESGRLFCLSRAQPLSKTLNSVESEG